MWKNFTVESRFHLFSELSKILIKRNSLKFFNECKGGGGGGRVLLERNCFLRVHDGTFSRDEVRNRVIFRNCIRFFSYLSNYFNLRNRERVLPRPLPFIITTFCTPSPPPLCISSFFTRKRKLVRHKKKKK